MKKSLTAIFFAIFLLSSVLVTVNAATLEADEIRWFEWFNSLSEEEQMCISFRPANFYQIQRDVYGIDIEGVDSIENVEAFSGPVYPAVAKRGRTGLRLQ